MSWFESVEHGTQCQSHPPVKCKDCDLDGFCESCGGLSLLFEGRDVECISQYALTCDGCHELKHIYHLIEDPKTNLGYCEKCWLERIASTWPHS